MTLDAEVFDDAIASNPTAVQDLFAGTAGDDGAFDAI